MNIPPRIPKVVPGRPIPTQSLTRLAGQVARTARTWVGDGLSGTSGAGGPTWRDDWGRRVFARLAGTDAPYDGAEVYPKADGTWATLDGGRTWSGKLYADNGTGHLDGKVVEVFPTAGDWWRFAWRAKGTGGGQQVGVVPIPNCFCTAIPASFAMTSSDETANFGMFHTGTISYQDVPAGLASLNIGFGTPAKDFLGDQSWPDPVADGAMFRYLMTCSFATLSITRVYEESPYGSPYRDGVLYTWNLGGSNTCTTGPGFTAPFAMTAGVYFPGSDPVCVTLGAASGCTST